MIFYADKKIAGSETQIELRLHDAQGFSSYKFWLNVKAIPGEKNRFEKPKPPVFEIKIPTNSTTGNVTNPFEEKEKEKEKPKDPVELKLEEDIQELDTFIKSENGYLMEGGLPLNDPRQIKLIAEKLPFPVPYASKVSREGGIKVGFTKPVTAREDLNAMVEKGLVEVYLYSSQADKIIKGKGYQPKNLDTSDVLGILKKDDKGGIADDVFGAI